MKGVREEEKNERDTEKKRLRINGVGKKVRPRPQ